MASKQGERRLRPRLIVGVLGALALLIWFLVPTPFVRGIVAGVVAGPAAIALGLTLFARRIQRRVGEAALQPPPLPSARWDYELQVTDLEGQSFDFASRRGRPLVLNHWATWCAPCVAEMPSLARLRSAIQDLDIEVLCVSKEPQDKVRDFMSSKELDLPVFTLDGPLPDCFSSRGIPATFVIDRTGTIVFRHFGAAAWDDPTVVRFVRNLAETPDL
jgi:thiol-disulfide isomerase/thioredoxin